MKKDKKIKIGFVSLGCSKNLVDTEVMLAKLVSAGYEITPEDIFSYMEKGGDICTRRRISRRM